MKWEGGSENLGGMTYGVIPYVDGRFVPLSSVFYLHLILLE